MANVFEKNLEKGGDELLLARSKIGIKVKGYSELYDMNNYKEY